MGTQDKEEEPWCFEEARAFLKVSASTLYRYTSTKRIRHYKPNGRTLYFQKKDLLDFVYGKSAIEGRE